MRKIENENMICIPSDAINIVMYACRKHKIQASACKARTIKAQTMPEEERKNSYMRMVSMCKSKIGFDLDNLPQEKVHQILNTGLSACISFPYEKEEFVEFCRKSIDSEKLENEYAEYIKQNAIKIEES